MDTRSLQADVPVAEFQHLVRFQIAEPDADDQRGAVAGAWPLDGAEPERIGDALPVVGVEALWESGAGEQVAVDRVLDLEDVAARAIAGSQTGLIGNGIENLNVKRCIPERVHGAVRLCGGVGDPSTESAMCCGESCCATGVGCRKCTLPGCAPPPCRLYM